MAKKPLGIGDAVIVSVDGETYNGVVRAVHPAVEETGLPAQVTVSVDFDLHVRPVRVDASGVKLAPALVTEEAPTEEAPVESSEETPTEAPVVEATGEAPVEAPVEAPAESEAPIEAPVETPAE